MAMVGRLVVVLALVAMPAEGAMAFTIASTAFAAGAPIPRQYTCDGADRSPPLAWKDAPAGTKAYALVCDDPDAPAGTWVHWVLYDLPAAATALPEGVAADAAGLGGGRHGTNDFRKASYGGPCPPRGKPHRYFFTLYALAAPTGLPAGATKAEVLAAVAGHVLGRAELVGTYGR